MPPDRWHLDDVYRRIRLDWDGRLMTEEFDLVAELDMLAERLMLVDPSDADDMAALREQYAALLTYAESTDRPELVGSCAYSLDIVTRMPKGDGARESLSDLGTALVGLRDTALGTGLAPSRRIGQPGAVAESEFTPTKSAPLAGDDDLLSDFVARAGEYLDDADERLLTLEREPENRGALDAVFRAFHTIKGMAGFLALNAVEAVCHEAEGVLEVPRKEHVPMTREDISLIFGHIDTMRSLIGSETEEQSLDMTDAKSESEHVSTDHKTRATIRVSEDRLDLLLDTIGELVIAEASAGDTIRKASDRSDELDKRLSRLDKITRELQEMATSLRMVPVKATFNRLARLTRDVGTKSGKRVQCTLAGQDTELDKAVVDAIADPLMHLVRNAVDHGIESDPSVRERAGKPATATIRLHAKQIGSGIQIKLSDDGRGFDLQAIKAKAADMNIDLPEDPSEDDLLNVLFTPGFSTASRVTEVSGRGVGLDVVRRAVESLRGTIDIESEPGKGTSFTIQLPLTLAIIDGMIARVGDEQYVLPTLSIIRSVRPEPEDITNVLDIGETLRTNEGFIPIVRLGQVFGVENAEEDLTNGVAVIVSDGDRKAAVFVCQLLGQQQTVIKPLSDVISDAPGISGGAIMADGGVGLIVDIAGIVRLTLSEGVTQA